MPGTVRYLRLAVASLLHFSGYSFRLVANGLDRAERQLLADYCDSSPRLEYFDYPVSRMLDHGTMLNVLFQREASPWFAMADSDIFAVAPFEAELESALEECDVFSSCLPLSMPPEMVLAGFSGRCLETPGGLPLAPTYFSLYRTGPFRRIIGESRIGFEVYHPGRFLPELPEAVRTDDLLQARRLDTAKLLNVVASGYGVRFRHRELDALVHIGGISRKRGNWRESWRRRFRGWGDVTEARIEREVRRRSRNKGAVEPGSIAAQNILSRALRTPLSDYFRCPPWRAKRRRVVPGSREATRDTRRAEGAKGDPKGASERGVQSYGRPVCSRNELAMLWRNAG